MKGRESGMPEEAYWNTFFDADTIIRQLHCAPLGNEAVAEFGCGYGTFSMAVARKTRGTVYAFDIEQSMVEHVAIRCQQLTIENIICKQHDISIEGSGLEDDAVDHVMIYNLLHIEESPAFLKEASRILKPGASLSVIHWNYDPSTPRGPSMAIRPRPNDIIKMCVEQNFTLLSQPDIASAAPHHYGMVFKRR